MKLSERIGLAVLRRIEPERAHALALGALARGLVRGSGPVRSDRLSVGLAGLDLPNPVGLAAGFDKNAMAPGPLSQAGFGFLEFGAATPRPQPGNPAPRLFRLTEDRAVINRFGFNNDGASAIAARLAAAPSAVPRGLNLGANKDGSDRADDFACVLREAGPSIDFATVNVSSPNTERLRDLQGAAALEALLDGVMAANAVLARPVPIFLKIAPDLDAAGLADVAAIAEAAGIAAIVATNTTLARDGLQSRHRAETGGLSGTPLFERSTRVLARLSRLTRIPLIGVGGIGSADDALTKIRAGANAVQLYTAMVYGGLSLARTIPERMDERLARDRVGNVAELVGSDRDAWL